MDHLMTYDENFMCLKNLSINAIVPLYKLDYDDK